MLFTSLLKNKVFFYLGSRYLTYFIQFVTSIVIAAELGPYYMGIWGFILLVLQYFQQFHLGIANSFNVLYVHHRDNQKECNNYIGNSLALICYLSLLVIGFYLVNAIIGIPWIEKFHANKYMIWVCMIAILQYFVQFFINLFRVKNQLNRVTFSQSIIVVLNFLCIFLFKGEQLIFSLVAGYFLGNLMCVIMAFTSGSIPLPKDVNIASKYQGEILKKGLFLFLYNSCFYFILISIRTIISGNYSIEEFGLFTFSFSLAHAILLILDALSFIIFPKVIGKLSSNDKDEVTLTIKLLRTTYITSAHFLVYIALPFFPVVLWFLPKYDGAITSLNMIALTFLMGTCTYGYMELLISRNKERLAAALSSSALILNCILALLLVLALHVTFSFVISATMITYFAYSIMVLQKAFDIIGEDAHTLIKTLMPVRLFVPFIVSLTITILQAESLMFLPVLIFVILNAQTCIEIFDVIKKIIYKPDIVNLR